MDTLRDLPSRRVSLSPKKNNTQGISAEMLRLESELDKEEIELRLYEIKEHNSEDQKQQEVEVYEKYIETLLHCLCQTDNRLGKSLKRGWKGYNLALQKVVKPSETMEKAKQVEVKDIGIQHIDPVTDNFLENNLDLYIASLHNVLKGVNKIHMGKIVSKLDELSRGLQIVDVPSPSSSPDLEVDFTDTIKAIHTKLRTNIKPRKIILKQRTITKNTVNVESQTYIRLDDLKNIENFRIIIIEKDSAIIELNTKLRKLEDIEELYMQKSKECERLKETLYEKSTTICSQCKVKNKAINENLTTIKSLELSVYKSITVEKELELTKHKLKSTMDTIVMKNDLIIKLEENVGVLEKVVEETKVYSEELKSKLNTEHQTRVKLEKALKNEGSGKNNFRKSTENRIRPNFDALDFQDSEIVYQSKTPNFVKTQQSIRSQKTNESKGFALENLDHGLSSSISNSPNKRKLGQNYEKNNGKALGLHGEKALLKVAENKIIEVLKMTKEEYLALSKRAKMDLYECLFEHKEKCGTECEHLKRAMLIRFKDKGQLFPMKKYNIS